MKRFLQILILAWSGLGSLEGFSAPQFYYLGWADVTAIERGIQVVFKPIDCNVCSFAVILPKQDGNLIAHFEVPLISAADRNSELENGRFVAQKAEFISKGTVSKYPNRPALVLLKEGGLLWIDGSSSRFFERSECVRLTANSLSLLTGAGLFEKIDVETKRSVEPDPFEALGSFAITAPHITTPHIRSEGEQSLDAPRNRTNSARGVSNVHDAPPALSLTGDSGSSHMPTLARVWPQGNRASIGSFCHALLFYGMGSTDLPSFPSGVSLLQVLTDEQTAIRTLGRSPFVKTRYGVRYRDDHLTDVKESHRDICLATFAALNLPLNTPIRLNSGVYAISDLVTESVANFYLNQREPAWTAIAYARYVAPRKEWVNRYGERTSFSELVEKLAQMDLNQQSCAGTHVLQALVEIDNANHIQPVLEHRAEQTLHRYLFRRVNEIVQLQQTDGSWNEKWCEGVVSKVPVTPSGYRVLVTGHLAEALSSLRADWRPPESVYSQAAEYLTEALLSSDFRSLDSDVCSFTHATRARRSLLECSRRTNHATLRRTE